MQHEKQTNDAKVTNRGIKRHENKTGLNELAVKKSRSKTVKNLKLYEL